MANDATNPDSDYEQIKRDLMRRGRGVAEAEAIAARTVKRNRAQPSAERYEDDNSAPTRVPQSQRSYRELYAEAKERGITGRSMSKEELERRLNR